MNEDEVIERVKGMNDEQLRIVVGRLFIEYRKIVEELEAMRNVDNESVD